MFAKQGKHTAKYVLYENKSLTVKPLRSFHLHPLLRGDAVAVGLLAARGDRLSRADPDVPSHPRLLPFTPVAARRACRLSFGSPRAVLLLRALGRSRQCRPAHSHAACGVGGDAPVRGARLMVRCKHCAPGTARRTVHLPRHHAHVHPCAACRPLSLVAALASAPQPLVVGVGCGCAAIVLLGSRPCRGSAALRHRGVCRAAAAARRRLHFRARTQSCRRPCRHSPHLLDYGQRSAIPVGVSAQRHILLPSA